MLMWVGGGVGFYLVYIFEIGALLLAWKRTVINLPVPAAC